MTRIAPPGAGSALLPPEDPTTAALEALRRRGFGRLFVEGRTITIEEALASSDMFRDAASLAVIVDRLRIGPDVATRLTDSIETAFREGDRAAFAIEVDA